MRQRARESGMSLALLIILAAVSVLMTVLLALQTYLVVIFGKPVALGSLIGSLAPWLAVVVTGLMLAAAFGRHGMSAVFVGLLVVDGLLVLLIMFGPSWARTTPTEPAPVSTWPTHCVEHSGGGNKCPGG